MPQPLPTGYRKILVPLDFSGITERVIESALRVLDPKGQVLLMHVVEWMPTVTEGTFGVYAHRRDIEQTKRLAREKLEEYVRQYPGVPLFADVQEGRPASVILDVAAATKPDLIVIGAHGRSGLDHFLIGSTTERVIRKASCSVLAVRP